jgi:hypothetical protein
MRVAGLVCALRLDGQGAGDVREGDAPGHDGEQFVGACEYLGDSSDMMDMDCFSQCLQASFLTLESLVYITALNTDQNLKNELLNLGALQWIVLKGAFA